MTMARMDEYVNARESVDMNEGTHWFSLKKARELVGPNDDIALPPA